ncbi:MAG TPA: hypothetical protein VN861_03505 [Candidatus Acidoferrales bacterium]|nr:hypothetical protein [Candidatus Acidoferrales bacterium]
MTVTTISPILIEALARRAHKLADDAARMEGGCGPDKSKFKEAFEDELARFNTPVDTPKRVSMTPTPQPSLGKGIGQVTGGTAQSDTERAITLLKMIGSCPWDEDDGPLDGRTRDFIRAQFERYEVYGVSYVVTGKQLHWLSDAKDKLVDRGIL